MKKHILGGIIMFSKILIFIAEAIYHVMVAFADLLWILTKKMKDGDAFIRSVYCIPTGVVGVVYFTLFAIVYFLAWVARVSAERART